MIKELDYSQIDNVEVDGIDESDYPDFTDAYISSADYNGKEMSDDLLQLLNEDFDFVYDAVQSYLF